jgi:membrane fusion protein (multidrug efflux system)
VLRVLHQVGTWIDKDVNHNLVELYDPAQLQVRVDVPQRSIRQVAVGAVAEIRTDAHPDHTWSATVIRIEPLAELAKNTITVRAEITDPDERLFPEMTCQVLFKANAPSTTDRSLRIPAQALRSDATGPFVFIAENGVARRVSVTALPAVGAWVTISTGLRSGQRIITSDPAGLRDGAAITEQP